jgi:hypothetical protein
VVDVRDDREVADALQRSPPLGLDAGGGAGFGVAAGLPLGVGFGLGAGEGLAAGVGAVVGEGETTTLTWFRSRHWAQAFR